MSNERILVVDDDKEIVRLMRGYLEQAGYQVLAAYDGETAMHILRAGKPDLLLLDIMLPDRDGWDITRLIRSNTQLADIPIIMLTAVGAATCPTGDHVWKGHTPARIPKQM